jgi:putative phage-type endonuclease
MNENELTQGTPAWLALRKTKITSSDVACLLGCAAYAPFTPLQLWERKMGLVKDEQNFAMQRGREIEEPERRLLEKTFKTLILPKVVVQDFMMTSLDGISPDGKTLYEIKLASSANMESLLAGKVPDHYRAQCMWHLACCPDATSIVLHTRGRMSEKDEHVVIDTVLFRDEPFILNAIAVAKKFYEEHLITGIAPEPTMDDVLVIDDSETALYASQYRKAKERLVQAQNEIDEIKKNLVALGRGRNLSASGLMVSRTYRTTLDYKQACLDNNIAVEKYARAPVSYWLCSDRSSHSKNQT